MHSDNAALVTNSKVRRSPAKPEASGRGKSALLAAATSPERSAACVNGASALVCCEWSILEVKSAFPAMGRSSNASTANRAIQWIHRFLCTRYPPIRPILGYPAEKTNFTPYIIWTGAVKCQTLFDRFLTNVSNSQTRLCRYAAWPVQFGRAPSPRIPSQRLRCVPPRPARKTG